MPADSTTTKANILAAARSEFARYGLAGARVDRIAMAAKANKRLIYVYFGSKEDLFDLVIEQCLASAVEAVPFDASDLPGYAAALFDYLVAKPETLRLTTWNQLERGGRTPASSAAYRAMVRAIGEAQARHEVNSTFAPLDLLVLVQSLVRAWFVASPALQSAGPGESWSGKRLAKHRAAVIRAVASLAGPAGEHQESRGRSAGSR